MRGGKGGCVIKHGRDEEGGKMSGLMCVRIDVVSVIAVVDSDALTISPMDFKLN